MTLSIKGEWQYIPPATNGDKSMKKMVMALGVLAMIAGPLTAVSVRAGGSKSGGGSTGCSGTCTPIRAGIAGWWKFNDGSGIVANDASDTYTGVPGTDGTLVGSTVFATDAVRGGDLSVYGISGQVTFPYNTAVQPITGTVSVWVKPSSLVLMDIVQQQTNQLLRCNMKGTFTAYAIRVDGQGRAYGVISNDDPKTCKTQTQVYTNVNTIPLNVWTHIAMEWDGSKLTIFINGAAAGSVAYNANPTYGLSYSGTSPLLVAAPSIQFASDFLGQVSDLRIYKRALTATEIANIYHGQ